MSYLIQYVRERYTLYAIIYKWNLKNKLVNTAKINRLIDTENKLVLTVGRGMAKGARWGRAFLYAKISGVSGSRSCIKTTIDHSPSIPHPRKLQLP